MQTLFCPTYEEPQKKGFYAKTEGEQGDPPQGTGCTEVPVCGTSSLHQTMEVPVFGTSPLPPPWRSLYVGHPPGDPLPGQCCSRSSPVSALQAPSTRPQQAPRKLVHKHCEMWAILNWLFKRFKCLLLMLKVMIAGSVMYDIPSIIT